MTVKEFNLKAVIKELQTKTELMTEIYWLFDDDIDNEENPDKPYIHVAIVSDIPDPIESKTRVEFRIISNDENTPKSKIRKIDNILVSILPEIHLFNWEFNVYNIVPEDWYSIDEPKLRQWYIRDFLFFYIN